MVRLQWSCWALAGLGSAVVAFGAPPSRPGDCNLDWLVDLADHAEFHQCLAGPGAEVTDQCPCHDSDDDGDVDLGDFGAFQAAFRGSEVLAVEIALDGDDGTEVNDETWHADGYADTGCNRMGRDEDEQYDIGLRFRLPQVAQGETFVCARLVLPGGGDGKVDSTAAFRIVGIDRDGVATFETLPPSVLPKTTASVPWDLTSGWPDPNTGSPGSSPLLRYSPDVSTIINEVVGRERWGQGAYGKTLGIVVEDDGSEDTNFLAVEDLDAGSADGRSDPVSPRLELYRTLASTFVARPLLGRPTDHSITINAMSLVELEVYALFGTIPGNYTGSTVIQTYPGGTPFEIVVEDLVPDTRYYYRLCCRPPGVGLYEHGPERTFRTQRGANCGYRFTVQSDSHLWEVLRQGTNAALYRTAMANVAADEPDFHVDLGDTFLCEDYSGRDVLDFDDGVVRHLAQRPLFDLVCHSAPLFFVLGNHEGEQGWRLDGTPDNVAVWAANARKLIYPNPVPDGFYSGCLDEVEFVGLPENYYAFEWGEALFVMLDPYWYTTTKPHHAGASPGSEDNWDWTLGFEQYDWLRRTLEQSEATFKFVFSHQVTGGMDTYGRGGIDAASHYWGGHGSFEWGGEDLSGAYVFDAMRPGWGSPVHQLLADNHVTIFFHGHDHVFAKEELDGVIYQACPRPSDAMYGLGMYSYPHADLVNNSGHLRVTVAPWAVTVEYVRAYLPGDGDNGEVAYSYAIPAPK